jgi:hypothetical protein
VRISTVFFLVMMSVGVLRGFFQLTVRRLQMFERLFGVTAQFIAIIGAGSFRFLPRGPDVMLRGCQMRMPMGVDVLYRPLCDRYASQNQQYGQHAAP